jgi:hypothetical protein
MQTPAFRRHALIPRAPIPRLRRSLVRESEARELLLLIFNHADYLGAGTAQHSSPHAWGDRAETVAHLLVTIPIKALDRLLTLGAELDDLEPSADPEPDEDGEPALGWTGVGRGLRDFRSPSDSAHLTFEQCGEAEPSLGSNDRMVHQGRWAEGSTDIDREEGHDDREPDADGEAATAEASAQAPAGVR